MAILKISNALLYGLSSDTKPNTYAVNSIFVETDTGKFYIKTGATTWALLFDLTNIVSSGNINLYGNKLIVRGSDGNGFNFVQVDGSAAPNQAVDLFSNYSTQAGATFTAFTFGYNSAWKTYEWYSTWSGSNKVYFTLDAAVNTCYFHTPLVFGDNDRVKMDQTGLTAQRTFTFPDTTVQLDGISNTSTHTNKTLDANANTLIGIAQDPLVRRTGSSQNVSPASGTTAPPFFLLHGIMSNYTPTGAGTNSQAWDTTEGLITTLITSTTASDKAGLIPPAGGNGQTRRAFATRARIRSKIDSTTSGRYYFGFSSASALPAASDTVLANSDSGILVGFSTASTNWTIYTHAGSGPATQTNVTGPIAKNAAYHTIEINWTAGGNANIIFDGVSQTVSTDLPATTTNLFFHAQAQNSTTTARSHLIKATWIEVAG